MRGWLSRVGIPSGGKSDKSVRDQAERALKLRDNRNIGDFRNWKDHDAYQKTLARLLRDLRVEPA